MGAWGADTFDNDTACDWTYSLEGTDDLSAVTDAFDRVTDGSDDDLDADDACVGLAACEVVARLKGRFGARNAYTEAVDQWVETHPQTPPPELVDQAVAVIDRILSAPSELLELWEEEDATEWKAAVNNLRKRLLA